MLYLQGSGAAATKLGETREWEIGIDTAVVDDRAMGDDWMSQQFDGLKFTFSANGNMDTTETSPFDAAVAKAVKKFYLYPDASQATRYYYGTIWPKLRVAGGLGKMCNFSLTGDGDGQLAAN